MFFAFSGNIRLGWKHLPGWYTIANFDFQWKIKLASQYFVKKSTGQLKAWVLFRQFQNNAIWNFLDNILVLNIRLGWKNLPGWNTTAYLDSLSKKLLVNSKLEFHLVNFKITRVEIFWTIFLLLHFLSLAMERLVCV